MSVLGTEPTVVLGVGESMRSPAVREVLLDGTATDVLVVETAAAVLETVDEREDVGCVVTDRPVADSNGIDLCRNLRERDVELPVVFYVTTARSGTAAKSGSDDDVVRRALNAGADGYYTDADEDAHADLRRAVDDAIERYDRRRNAFEESDVLATLLEEFDQNIYVKDEQGRYLRASPRPNAGEVADILGKTDVEVYDDTPEIAQQTYEDDRRVVETGEPIREQDEWYGEGRTAYAVRTTKLPWTDEYGDPKGVVGLTTDVTEFKHQERELETLRAQFEKFSSNVKHDLNNPLQVAIGHLQLGRETGDEDSFDAAMEALERIEEIITDLESIAKDEPSATEQGTNVLAEIADSVWGILYTRDATLENEISSTVSAYTAEQTIRPLFENLFKNAITHGGSGVTVRVGTLADGFYVEDTGPGIPESERDAVLDPGYTTSSKGSGMGLSIVADVCNQQGWTIDIGESDEGGARFEITNCPLVSEPTADDRSDVSIGRSLELDSETEIGVLDVGGSAESDSTQNRWEIAADGDNIWRHWNDFYYVHTAAEDPVRIQGRVTSLEDVDPFSKAGLMIRNGIDEDAAYGYVGETTGFGTELLWRTADGEPGLSHQLREETNSKWFRVDLLDGYVTCFVSRDGIAWTPVDQRRIGCADPVHVGLVVCSVVSGRQCVATFEDVSVFELETADEE